MKGLRGSLKEKIALLRLKRGDTEAFGYLYDLYSGKIYRYVYFRISEKSLAYDITQEVFLSAWEYITQEKKIQNVKALVYRIAYNKIMDHYREKHRQAVLLDDLGQLDEPQQSMKMTDVEMHLLRKKILELKPEYQDIIILKHIEGLSINEIMDIVGKDSSAVRVTLHRAMSALKEKFELQHPDKE